MFKSIFGWGLVFCLILLGFWYFSIKEHDYSIQFETPAPPGKVYQKLLDWNYESIENKKIDEKFPFEKIIQKVEVKNSPISLTWEFLPLNDSLTQVNISVKNQENVFANRWKLLISKTSLQKELKKNILQFKKALKADLNFYNIEIVGKAIAPKSICACISLSNKTDKKAYEMIGNMGFLSDYILENNLEMNGKPRVQVTNWNVATNSIDFDFCFPLKPNLHFPESDRIFIKKIPAQKAIRAIYNGNYRNSHQAWFKLLNYANIHRFKVEKKPLEIFHNNPEIGGNSIEWKTEIFLPLRSNL